MKLAEVVKFEERRKVELVEGNLVPGPIECFLTLEKAGKQLKVKVSEEAISFVTGA